MSVFVTGAAGFVGLAVTEALLMRGERVIGFLPRSHLRDWLYARDATAAVLELLYARARRHQVYNLAAGFKWSIADCCARLQQVRSGFEWRFAQQGEAANIDYYAPYDRAAMAIERLRGETAFLPRYNLPEALADYVQWLGPAFDPGGTPS
jgi:nucleoside-diphosphate-sugar epimerase